LVLLWLTLPLQAPPLLLVVLLASIPSHLKQLQQLHR
jgi:hypothetical protein